MTIFVSNLVGEINTAGVWICVEFCGDTVMTDCRRSVGSVLQKLFAHYTKLSAYIWTFLPRPSARLINHSSFMLSFLLSLLHGSVLRWPLCGLITLSCIRSLWDCNDGFKRCWVPQMSLHLACTHTPLSLSVWLICRVGRGNRAKAVVGRRMACGKCTKVRV